MAVADDCYVFIHYFKDGYGIRLLVQLSGLGGILLLDRLAIVMLLGCCTWKYEIGGAGTGGSRPDYGSDVGIFEGMSAEVKK
jgi:hypothetical protein